MSDLSEKLENALKHNQTLATGTDQPDILGANDNVVALSPNNDKLDAIPGFEGMRDYTRVRSFKAINRVYRRNAGRAPFGSPADAVDATKDAMLQEYIRIMFQTFGDGIQMGMASSPAYRKYKMFRKLDEVFDVENWREVSDKFAEPFQNDYESVEMAERIVMGTLTYLGPATGYAMAPEDLADKKIWDLWVLTGASGYIAFYVAGFYLGGVMAEEEILAGSLAAMEDDNA